MSNQTFFKIAVLVLCLMVQSVVFADDYDAGYEKGYEQGYTDGELTLAPLAPLAPLPGINEENNYMGGFKRGVIDGYEEKMRSENESKDDRIQELEDQAEELQSENESLRNSEGDQDDE